MSFTESIIKTLSTPINLFYGTDQTGHKAYWFVRCSHTKFKLLKERFNTGPIDFNDYGPVIASGFGHQPSDEIKKMLREKYNYDADSLK